MNPSPHGAEATLGKTAAAALEARGFLREHVAYYWRMQWGRASAVMEAVGPLSDSKWDSVKG